MRGHTPTRAILVAGLYAFAFRQELAIFSGDRWLFIAPALVFFFYLAAWSWIGPEPKPGAMVARYEPPEGLSPAAVRYVASGTTDGRSFAAVIAQLAVRGCLRVEPGDGKYRLSRLISDPATESALAPEERRTLSLLFEDGPVIELSTSMNQHDTAQNGRYVFHIHEELTKQFGDKYFTRHSGIIALGVLATFAMVLLLAATARGRDASAAVFLTTWILFCGLTLGMLIELSFIPACKTAMLSPTGWMKLLPGSAAIAVFVAAIGYLLTKLAAGVSLNFAVVVGTSLLVNLGWGPLLKRKSPLGREVFDRIAGYRQFLRTAERERLDRLNLATESPQQLDRFLPFAIALEVKEAHF